MTEQKCVLQIKGLRKGFGQKNNRVEVLDDLNMSLGQGAFEVVMGPSGSGKSTLLHLIAGLLTPDSGEIRVNGELLSAMDDNTATRFRRRRIGMIFQDFNLIPALNVEENIVLPILLDRATPDQERVNAVMEEFKLRQRRAHLPHQLSGGERQRVAIARALINQPALILADEPTGNLDSPTGHAFCDLLRALNQNHGCSILLVSHDPVVAASAHHAHLLRDGRFVADFPTASNAALVSERYLQTMQAS